MASVDANCSRQSARRDMLTSRLRSEPPCDAGSEKSAHGPSHMGKSSVRKLQASSLMKSSAVLKIMAPVSMSVSRGNVGESSASALL